MGAELLELFPMSSLSVPFFRASPAAAAPSGGSSFAAALRHRRKHKEAQAKASEPSVAPDADDRPQVRTAHSLQSSSTLGAAVSAAAAAVGGGASYGSFAPLVTRLSRAASASPQVVAAAETRRPSASHTVGSTLDTVSEVRDKTIVQMVTILLVRTN